MENIKKHYIDSNALLEYLYEANTIDGRTAKLINQFPEEEVVEVVRCKDCIYWEEYDGTNGELNCGHCSEILNRTTYYLFFCADGNRKDGDED